MQRLGLALPTRVTISHGFVLGTLPQNVQEEIVEKLAEAGVSWTTVAMGGTAPLPWQQMRQRSVPLGLGVVSKKVVQSLERADASKGRVWACQVVVGC
ncbi:hypothetical protein FHS67_005667, partial [Aminobacter aminovorans]|nr:hypothetical protein [Aminobacter aminovorans]